MKAKSFNLQKGNWLNQRMENWLNQREGNLPNQRVGNCLISERKISCQKGLGLIHRKRIPLGIVLRRTARGVLLFGMGRE